MLDVAGMAKSTYEYAIKRIDVDPNRELKDRIKHLLAVVHVAIGESLPRFARKQR